MFGVGAIAVGRALISIDDAVDESQNSTVIAVDCSVAGVPAYP
jgi:hypothetical protein